MTLKTNKYYVICKKHKELGCILIKYVNNFKEAVNIRRCNKDYFYKKLDQ